VERLTAREQWKDGWERKESGGGRGLEAGGRQDGN
jgi:hypothetical protein